ncbi:MAG TPA: hypothetical protein VHY21_04390 [Pseudonocardiaceae bacterium]|jgi:hypothetical protein|nr:hypothetical protein [Pseudonocardiaceae bacterium]
MRIDRLDHLLLTVADIEVTTSLYRDVLARTPVVLGDGRTALHFGASKPNLHKAVRSSNRRPPTPYQAAPTSAW